MRHHRGDASMRYHFVMSAKAQLIMLIMPTRKYAANMAVTHLAHASTILPMACFGEHKFRIVKANMQYEHTWRA